MIKYFHELTRQEFEELLDTKITYGQLAIDYPQPEWCQYPNATQGAIGCWSLMSFYVTGKEFCNKCNFTKKST